MTALIVILLLLAALLYLPVGADVGYCEGAFTAYARVGAWKLCVYPRKQKPKKEKKPKKQPAPQEAAPAEEAPKKKKGLPDVTKDEVLGAVRVVFRAIKRLRFRLNRLKLHFISAFPDPYDTAMIYGYANAGLNALGLTSLKQSDIQLGVDFNREHYYADGYLSVTIRIYYVLKFAFCALFGLLPLYFSRRKRLKLAASTPAGQGKDA